MNLILKLIHSLLISVKQALFVKDSNKPHLHSNKKLHPALMKYLPK